mgnify:CR=1 FL=1
MPDVAVTVVNLPVLGVVPPIAGGLLKSNVPPSVRLPVPVTVPVKVKPLIVPVPLTDVTVPTLTLPPRLIALPLIVIELLVNAELAIPLNVPPRVKLPDVVTVPVKVKPLTVPVPLTEVTVPPNDGNELVIVIARE